MIDLHCHILPSVDDGPQTIEQSVEMARCAMADGIHTMVATPHSFNGVYHNSAKLIDSRVKYLQKQLAIRQIPLNVYSGSEIRIHAKLAEYLNADKRMTINRTGRYVLVELPYDRVPPGTRQMLFQLILNGVIPVLAHPERNSALQHDPKIVFDLVNMGCLVQLTAMSITGELGRDAMRSAHLMLRHGWAHVIATDSHNTDSRPPRLSQAVAAAKEILGDTAGVGKMVADTPRQIIDGESLDPPTPLPLQARRRKRWRERLFGSL